MPRASHVDPRIVVLFATDCFCVCTKESQERKIVFMSAEPTFRILRSDPGSNEALWWSKNLCIADAVRAVSNTPPGSLLCAS